MGNHEIKKIESYSFVVLLFVCLGVPFESSGDVVAGWTDEGNIVRLTSNKDNVGIGTTDPQSRKLKVVGDVEINAPSPILHISASDESPARLRFEDSQAASSEHFDLYFHADDQDLHFRSDQKEMMMLSDDGIIYFSPKNLHKIHPPLSGTQFAIGWNHSGGRGETAFYQHGGGGYRSGYDFWSQRDGKSKHLLASLTDTGYLVVGGVVTPSDARKKTNVRPISNALDKLTKLQGVYFNWKDKNAHDSETHLGLIGQEVLEVVPEVVMGGVDEKGEEGHYSLQYDGLVPLLIEGLKEQQQLIDDLAARLSELDGCAVGSKPFK